MAHKHPPPPLAVVLQRPPLQRRLDAPEDGVRVCEVATGGRGVARRKEVRSGGGRGWVGFAGYAGCNSASPSCNLCGRQRVAAPPPWCGQNARAAGSAAACAPRPQLMTMHAWRAAPRMHARMDGRAHAFMRRSAAGAGKLRACRCSPASRMPAHLGGSALGKPPLAMRQSATGRGGDIARGVCRGAARFEPCFSPEPRSAARAMAGRPPLAARTAAAHEMHMHAA